MLILGIDPGTRNCGYALISLEGQKMKLVEAGLIKIKSEGLQYQIPQIAEAIGQLFSLHKIQEVAMEDIFYAHNPKTVLKLAQFRGAIMLKLLQEHGEFSEYTALQVKKALTGKAKAAKEQVAFMVKQILGITKEIKPLDITDAMAVAITHAQRVKLEKGKVNKVV
ncbi:MAG TPA: crossover junction endodeoxyribonuclease RuvC [Sulfuricurvum sp.]|nr:MAG: crossover junction endodeoxyribonuclease RuvC [Campylobacterales bacterium 16-40-21]OZA02625.1 MAG: crossover junction endodeoxyribonuclease RuvC [Sulfuricurvum sp. 17-40-25]HQS67400.1 crossover junction endodeoxyribonuclease RuvC [Sulfuricurvum sp.]HQT37653.1 crossover junction endodeoxyribonuclease RuvC [Sulfuricurvum sp.]